MTTTYTSGPSPSRSPARDTAPPRPGVARFGHELTLVAGLLGLAFWCLALVSYSRADPAWSTSGALNGGALHNLAGRLGAWIADVSYFSMGYSVWWLVVVAAMLWLRSGRRWLRSQDMPILTVGDRLRFWSTLLLLLSTSSALEWVWLVRLEPSLPDHAGGVLGYVLGLAALRWLGTTGSTLLGIGGLLIGMAGVFRFSWGTLAEAVGAGVDALIHLNRQRREKAIDEAQGRKAAREREEVLAQERAEHSSQPHDPLLIVTPPPVEPAVIPAATPTATAAARQAPLFPDGPAPAAAPPAIPLPGLQLLDCVPAYTATPDPQTLEMTSRLIEKKLKDFGVEVHITQATPGPVITRYDMEPASGVKGSQVTQLAKDLARALSLAHIRVLETVPGKNCMALELPNARRQPIALAEVLGSQIYHTAASLLTLGLGKDVEGKPVVADLAKMPHVLVAGTTGSGKSVGINAMILSLLYKARPQELRLLLIDPKMLELSAYEGIPHLLCPVVTDMRLAVNGLAWCVAEMERRYQLMARAGVRSLSSYNEKTAQPQPALSADPTSDPSTPPPPPAPPEPLPHIVIVIDELADLMMVAGKQAETHIARIAQKARAAGIHLVLATQRPSVNVVTGLIKANVPTRMAFQVSSKTDSRIVLDQSGAEGLLGMGDMLYLASGSSQPIRVHGAFVSDGEVQRVVGHLRKQSAPRYIPGVLDAPSTLADDH